MTMVISVSPTRVAPTQIWLDQKFQAWLAEKNILVLPSKPEALDPNGYPFITLTLEGVKVEGALLGGWLPARLFDTRADLDTLWIDRELWPAIERVLSRHSYRCNSVYIRALPELHTRRIIEDGSFEEEEYNFYTRLSFRWVP